MNAEQRITLQLGELLKMVCILSADKDAFVADCAAKDARIKEQEATIKELEAKLPSEPVDSETPK